MELKHIHRKGNGKQRYLLIVPYGIETEMKEENVKSVILLIVPYGIETYYVYMTYSKTTMLLIVPYGIETRRQMEEAGLNPAFNRTLWN